ncbi:binuclear zinc transcription factor [Cordyceps fumosorosea ARSEF 2679]|uniref:Binuclear zinc transcription factor n=1 Tax=Cordyceps fumosorosea (strain ARSEF 2679) TaxID=1081104 RepID=A0A167WME6_CORFA|nr:binuclear zinc transcription factor [Cordyceps fumosorosea ARSEF 2679]OAA63973.1 binuclear zinc transcription factor [Cordyceps fumosorosea ARSEF 2679]
MAGSVDNGQANDSPVDDRAANGSPTDNAPGDAVHDNSTVPKPKRLACMICRKRKLKCDGLRPSCSTCSRLGHACAYDEQRRKSGPKRGYVKALEERLKQVETLLKTQEPSQPPSNTKRPAPPPPTVMTVDPDMDRWNHTPDSPRAAQAEDFNFNANPNPSLAIPVNADGSNFSWEMIGLGLEEPLPAQESIDELHQIYFEKIHPSMPMIHRYRYLAAMNLAPHQRPPVCLRYAMWTMASSITDKYSDLKHLFYARARKYVEADYVKGFGEHMISVAHCQAHILLACYEMKMMYFPRAWINTGAAVRLAQMIGLHRLDGAGLDVKQCLPPPKDWTEREERRRTFWMAFCEDRYASIGTGWPMTIDERDILTKLPSSEEAFEMSRPEQTQTLDECTTPSGAAKLSAFGAIVLLAAIFGRNLVHLHRPDSDEFDGDVNGPFWKRHREMDNILLNTSLGLPSHLKLPAGLSSPNIVFMNMSIHTSTICLHQAAIFKAETHKLPASLSSESKVRCITAANEIAAVMRNVSHMDLTAMNPFISFTLYVAARVFVQYLKSRPDDDVTADSLRFLLSAMNALKKRNPLTESFLVQLDVDFEALASRIPRLKNAFPRSGDSPDQNGDESPRILCDDPENVKGILSYRECDYAEDEHTKPPAVSEPSGMGLASSAAFGGQAWLSVDQQIPMLTPNSSSMYDKTGNGSGHISSFGDMNGESTESPDGQSNGRTPNSSNGSDGRTVKPVNPSAAQLFASGASPQFPDTGAHFFSPAPQQFPMQQPQQLGAQTMSFGNGWDDISAAQQAANIQNEGVLRALMNMGPMEAMDLSSWDTGNEPMRG